MINNTLTDNNKKVKSLQQTFRDTYNNKYLMDEKENLSKKWLNQRKMNLHKRNKARTDIKNRASMDVDQKPKHNTFPIGNMFFFSYDAKTKKQLPYWDAFPLVLPFAIEKHRIYGMNLHYMPKSIREMIFTLLEKSRDGAIKISSKVLVQQLAKEKIFAPSIHCYLPSNITSKMDLVEPEEWENVMFLPVQKFVSVTQGNPTQGKVYSDYNKRL
jgi:hypothetical protein